MKNETSEIMVFILICVWALGILIVVVWHSLNHEIQEIKHHQQNTQYHSIPELDCYCQIHHVGKRDIFVNIEGDTVAVVNRK
jgi:flagellar basal body-associated protein FliL